MLKAIETRIRAARDRRLYAQLEKRRSARRQMLAYLKARGCDIQADLGDHKLLLDAADEFITDRVIAEGGWHRQATEATFAALIEEEMLTPGGVFVDIGANIGTQSIYALLSGQFASIAAFEPHPANFARLEQNIALNAMQPRARLHNIGVGAKDETLALSVNPRNLGAHSFRAAHSGETVSVPVRRSGDILTTEMLGGEPALIWIDVEGFEPEVIAGLGDRLAEDVPVIMEFSPILYGAERTEAFIQLLSERFTYVRAAAGEAQPIRSFDDLRRVSNQADIVLSGYQP